MAFVRRVGSLLKQSGSKHVSIGLPSSDSPFFQVIRSMSSAKLFVGGLSYGTDEMGLRDAFQEYGEVIEAKVITDRDSGRSRGFGFVSYTSADAANSALQDMDGKELHGRRIRVSFAQERPRPSFGGGGGYGGAGGYSGGGGFGGAGGYSGGGGSGGGGGYGDRSNNLGEYGDRNQNADGGDNLFGGGLDAASGISPGGGYGDRSNNLGGYGDRNQNADGGDNLFGGGLGAASGILPGGGYGDRSNNLGGYGDRNQNADGSDNLFGGGLGAASGISPGGGNEGGVGILNHDSAGSDGEDDYREDDHYVDPFNKCVLM